MDKGSDQSRQEVRELVKQSPSRNSAGQPRRGVHAKAGLPATCATQSQDQIGTKGQVSCRQESDTGSSPDTFISQRPPLSPLM